jgi:hypothetical protein
MITAAPPRMTKFERRLATLLRFGFRCRICGLDFLQSPIHFFVASVDHFIPKVKGGLDGEDNRIACCTLCNYFKAGDIFANIDEARRVIGKRKERFLSNYHHLLFSFPAMPSAKPLDVDESANIIQKLFAPERRAEL